MKRGRTIAAVLLLAGAAVLFTVQRAQVSAEISPRPLLYLLADTQRELERIPLRLTRVSDEEENQIGEQLARSYGWAPERLGTAESQKIAAYVRGVGLRVAVSAKRQRIRYRFYYRDEKYFCNAGALPGGQILIGHGLLELMRSEDELASVLAHEIVHVDQRHAIERFQYEMKSRQLGMRGLYRLAQMGVQLYQASYSKEQEDEADRLGLELAVAAGYSPAGAVDFMTRFELLRGGTQRPADSPAEEILRLPGQALGEYFRSHPTTQQRIVSVQKEIAARGWNAAQAQRPMPIRSVFLAERAEQLDKRGLFDRAAELFEEALKIEPNDASVWRKLARTRWRSGDTAKTVDAATGAVQRDASQIEAWRLLAQALAAEGGPSAPARFQQVAGTTPALDTHSAAAIRVEQAGLAYKQGERRMPQALAPWLHPGIPLRTRVMVHRRMAWWMYRAGDLETAEQLLERAAELDPTDTLIPYELAWVQSDAGKQASAQANLRTASASDADRGALEAVILARIEKQKDAEAAFEQAAREDPVWMVEAWVRHSYSAEAAAVLSKLRTAELARRRQADIRAGRAPSASATRPDNN